MKNSIKYLLASAGFIFAFGATAQDVHFSQMGYSPLNLNPGLAGAHSALQGVVNYRTQWNSVAVPYTTIGASVDGRFNENKRGKSGIIAGGINFFNDQSGNLNVKTTNVSVNLAYHLILDRTSTLGLGIYGGYGQRSISPDEGRWGSQYDGSIDDGYNATLSGGSDLLNNRSFSALDAGAGLVYAYKNSDGYMTQNNQQWHTGGVAFYHVNNPSYSFFADSDEKLYMRWSLFYNGIIGIENSRGAIEPGVYFNRQKTSMEILYGAYYRHTITEGSKVTGRSKPFFFHIGLFHRWGDALVAKSMLEWYEFSAGFAYDINISSLTEASNAKGGFEVFLRYNMEPGGVSKSKIR